MSSAIGFFTDRDQSIDTRKSRLIERVDAPICNIGIVTRTKKIELDGPLYLLAVMKTLTMTDLDEIQELINGRISRVDADGRELVWTEQLYEMEGQRFQVILPAGQSLRSCLDVEKLMMSRKYQNFLSYVMMLVLFGVNIVQTYQLLTWQPIRITPLWSAILTFMTTSVLFTFLFLHLPAVTFGNLHAFDVTQTDGRGNPVYRCVPVDSLSVPLTMYFSQIEVLRDTIPDAAQQQIAQLDREVDRLQRAHDDAYAEIENLERQNMGLRKKLRNAKVREFLDDTVTEELEPETSVSVDSVVSFVRNNVAAQIIIAIGLILVLCVMLYYFVLSTPAQPTSVRTSFLYFLQIFPSFLSFLSFLQVG